MRSLALFRFLLKLICLVMAGSANLRAESSLDLTGRKLIVIVGAGGTPQYEISFYQWSERWVSAARSSGIQTTVIGRHRGEFAQTSSDFDQVHAAFQQLNGDSAEELWIVLIGHGTFDRRTARFNLRGPDFSAEDLLEWIQPVRRPTAIINCSSASGPFLTKLTAANRIVVTATKSGTEIDFTRFGDYLSQAIIDPAADLDKDHQTSLWEAFLMASRRTADFYETEGRISTEHALLDDNGDGQAVRADQFRGLLPIKPSQLLLDGSNAHRWHLVRNQTEERLPAEARHRRNQLESEVEKLRLRKGSITSDDYSKQLELLLIELAELNERFDINE